MKFKLRHIIFLLFVVAIFYSCKKIDIPPSTPDNISANFDTVYNSFWAYGILQPNSSYNIQADYYHVALHRQLRFYGLNLMPGYIGTYKLDSATSVEYTADFGNAMSTQFFYVTDKDR